MTKSEACSPQGTYGLEDSGATRALIMELGFRFGAMSASAFRTDRRSVQFGQSRAELLLLVPNRRYAYRLALAIRPFRRLG